MGELTLLYDDGCALCARLSARLGRVDGVSLVPIGSDRGARLLHDLTPAQRDASLHVVDEHGGRQSGAAALPLVLRRMRGGGLAARVVERFPRAAAHAYSVIARNRMRLSWPLRATQARSVSRREARAATAVSEPDTAGAHQRLDLRRRPVRDDRPRGISTTRSA